MSKSKKTNSSRTEVVINERGAWFRALTFITLIPTVYFVGLAVTGLVAPSIVPIQFCVLGLLGGFAFGMITAANWLGWRENSPVREVITITPEQDAKRKRAYALDPYRVDRWAGALESVVSSGALIVITGVVARNIKRWF